jgi:hypothetical protein
MAPAGFTGEGRARANHNLMEETKIMSHLKVFALASCVGLLSAAFAPALKADEWNKKTILTVNEAIQVPNKTLEPGKYVMKLLDSPSNRHIVQIFDENGQHLITTVLAIPNYRLQPTGKTSFGFWETPAGQPKALRSWFYPGDNFGQEFAYPKNEALQIASVTHQPVPTTYAQSEADLTTARVGTVDQVGTERELDKQTYAQNNAPTTTAAEQPATPTSATPQEQPQQMAKATPPSTPAPAADQTADRQATPQSTPQSTPQTLPHTASPYPLVGLIGLFSIIAFGVMTVVRKRSV